MLILMEQANTKLGTTLVLLSALFFGSHGVWSRLIGNGMDVFFQGWTRALIILILIVPVLIWRKEISAIQSKDIKWLIVFLIFTSFTQAPLFYAFNHMDIGTASLLFFVSMFLTMNIIGVSFFAESITKIKIISALLALIGMYMVFSFSIAQFSVLAALMAIMNGVASGGEVAFSKKLTGNHSPLFVVSLSWVIILVTNLIISLTIGERQIAIELTKPWFWQICYSLVSLFGFWFVIAGFKHVDATIGALLGLLEIVFSVTFGVIIFKESLSPVIILGGVLILVSSGLPSVQGLFKFLQTKKSMND